MKKHKMRSLIIILMLAFSALLDAQNKVDSKENTLTFNNQGEQENYWSENFFKKEYKDTLYSKFTGEIDVVNSSTIKFENKTLLAWGVNNELFKIFETGLFYPQLLIGYELAKKEIRDDIDSHGRVLNNLLQPSDTLKISSFEELPFLNQSTKTKRFRFWVYWPGTMNPQVYFMELKNEKATAKSNFDFFIKEARLTFVKGGWIIL